MRYTYLIRKVFPRISTAGSDANCRKVIDLALSRVPHDIRNSSIETITQVKSSWSQKRAMLLKRGLLRSIVDELEVLSDTGEVAYLMGVLQSMKWM
jgi:hypothetical protein